MGILEMLFSYVMETMNGAIDKDHLGLKCFITTTRALLFLIPVNYYH